MNSEIDELWSKLDPFKNLMFYRQCEIDFDDIHRLILEKPDRVNYMYKGRSTFSNFLQLLSRVSERELSEHVFAVCGLMLEHLKIADDRQGALYIHQSRLKKLCVVGKKKFHLGAYLVRELLKKGANPRYVMGDFTTFTSDPVNGVLLDSILSSIEQKHAEEIQRLEARLGMLEEHIRYSPGGTGFLDASKHFHDSMNPKEPPG